MDDSLPFALDLRPPQASGALRTRYRVALTNQSDRILRIELDALDPQRQMTFAFSPKLVRLAPGERAVATLTVKPERVSWFGVRVSLPFSVVAREMLNVSVLQQGDDHSQSVSADAVFEQREVMSKSTLAIGVLALAAVGVFAYRPVKDAFSAPPKGNAGAASTTVTVPAVTTSAPVAGVKVFVTVRRNDETGRRELNALRERILAVLGKGFEVNTQSAPTPGFLVLVVENVPTANIASVCQRIFNISTDKPVDPERECKPDFAQLASTASPSSTAGSR